MLKQISKFITDNAATYAPLLAGLPVQLGELQTSPDEVIVLYEAAGGPPETNFGEFGVKVETPGLSARVRGKQDLYHEPRAKCFQLMNLLMRIEAVVLTDAAGVQSFYEIGRPDAMPFLLERDATRRAVWAVNFSLRKQP